MWDWWEGSASKGVHRIAEASLAAIHLRQLNTYNSCFQGILYPILTFTEHYTHMHKPIYRHTYT